MALHSGVLSTSCCATWQQKAQQADPATVGGLCQGSGAAAAAIEERGDLGGFLAANHKAWMAMWKDGLAPNTFEGLVDISIWAPAMLQSMGFTISSNDSAAGGGAGSSGSGSGDSSKPASSGRRRRRRGGRRQSPAA